ncbi:MAG: hypothetical protein AAFY56_21810 [Pseudomonadota bacterium]
MILGATFAGWYFARRLRRLLEGLDAAIQAVERTDGTGSFRQRFAMVYQSLAENHAVGETWRGYAPTLSLALNADAVGYARRPREDFNEVLFTRAGINLRLWHALPNIMVGVGLFFTFLGLIAALYFASRGVAASDIAVAQAALGDLLAAATFKFVTSVVGLGSSIVLSLSEKSQMHHFHQRVAQLCGALEARMVPLTSERLAEAQLQETRIQTAKLESLRRPRLSIEDTTMDKRGSEPQSSSLASAVRAPIDR